MVNLVHSDLPARRSVWRSEKDEHEGQDIYAVSPFLIVELIDSRSLER